MKKELHHHQSHDSLHIPALKARQIFIHTCPLKWRPTEIRHSPVKPKPISYNLKASLDHTHVVVAFICVTPPPLCLLTSVQKTIHPVMPCHRRNSCIYNCGASSNLLYQMKTTRSFIQFFKPCLMSTHPSDSKFLVELLQIPMTRLSIRQY